MDVFDVLGEIMDCEFHNIIERPGFHIERALPLVNLKSRPQPLAEVSSINLGKVKIWIEQMNTNVPLRIQYGDLSNLDAIPAFVKHLYVTANKIKRIDYIPIELVTFHVSMNPLEYIAFFPPGIRILNLAHTRLTVLPELPVCLQSLNLTAVPLRAPPLFPNSLKELYITGTRIKNISLPPRLVIFDCCDCDLDELPPLPHSLILLRAAYNNIRRVAEWPQSLQFLDLRYNPFEQTVPAYIKEYAGPNNQ